MVENNFDELKLDVIKAEEYLLEMKELKDKIWEMHLTVCNLKSAEEEE